jgi:hypothetical protein
MLKLLEIDLEIHIMDSRGSVKDGTFSLEGGLFWLYSLEEIRQLAIKIRTSPNLETSHLMCWWNFNKKLRVLHSRFEKEYGTEFLEAIAGENYGPFYN